jgi:hypothetical protein
MQEPQIVRPQPTRREDLAWNPRLLASWEEQERHGRGDGHAPPPSPAPTHRYTPHIPHAPQLSTAQRRANQTDQPRHRDGRYAEKPASKWQEHLTGQPAPYAPSRVARKPARAKARPRLPHMAQAGKATPRKKAKPLPSMAAMEHRNPIAKVHWWVTRGFRRWRRRKAKQFRKAFSLRG